MLADASVIGFIPCRSLGVAEQFYAGKLGLPVMANDGFALVLAAPGDVTIRCVLIGEFTAQPFTVFGWEVADIAAAARELAARQIEPLRYPHFQQSDEGIWSSPGGAKVLWFADPFGNVLSLSQHGKRT